MSTDATRTERLAAKLFCYQRSRRWDKQDKLPPIISSEEIDVLVNKLRKADPKQLQHIERLFHAC
jgi:hypothetical protein